ncbi:putative 3-demethylubiquinone-9 3-methyltransferase (glyoxalase superfamily) [Ochrobactrum daejeonense]|uniref:Putative 3-demethylubiquinone-9 3-methyltransferase (Glyoxalase superfamily) n=1 Tax=Brucella daejeonensis TaxID=659015 RepID=A0A7W9AXM6_9HYPH|nr:VOC family protein [Brucella daejeonensis]MBB5702504.1 putative 3-demethylubiquinone-9 3-methyltransferase (glyoxalase superfamily) [Brucella daejeonensis]NKB79196.1 VOC family protein [Brucella daejeonensis]
MTQVCTHLMFQGSASAALETYRSIFPDFQIDSIKIYDEESASPGKVQIARVSFAEHRLIVIDSPIPHQFDFNPSISLFVDFHDEEKLDSVFEKLSDGGEILMPLDDYGFSKRFAWIKDKYGVSWQLNLQT